MHSIKLLCVLLCAFCFTSLVFAQVNSNYPGNGVNIDCCADPTGTANTGFYYFVVAPPARTFECKLNLQRKGGFRNWIDLDGNDQTPFSSPFVDPRYSGYGYEGRGCTVGGVGPGTCGAGFCAQPNNAAPFGNRAMMDDNDYSDSQYSSECYTSGGGFTGTASTQCFIRTWTSRVSCPVTGVQRATQLIEIRDNEPPQLSIPADITLECSSDSDYQRLIGNAEAFDTCYPVDVTVAAGAISGSNCARVQQFTWTARETTSECQLTSQAVQRVTVVDTTPPVIQKLPSYTLQCTQPLNIPAVTPTVSDSCFLNNLFGTAASSDNRINGPCAGTYTVERTWSASDICGNVGYQVQYIFVEDVTPPTFTGYVPADTFTRVNCFQDVATSPNFQSLATLQGIVTDDCSAIGVSVEEDRYVENDGSVNAVDNINYVQEFTATDGCGNSVSWANRFSIASNINGGITQTLGLTGPATAAKGTAFTLALQYTPVPACTGQDSRTALTVDAGAATLTGVAGCVCTQQATGTVFCNNVPAGTCNLSFTVPTTFLPNSLLFSASVNVPAGEIFGETTHFVTFS